MEKTKEELLKIYSAYLPYELEFQTRIGYTTEGNKLKSIDSDHVGMLVLNNNPYFEAKKAKPILYSMDMLTKEIEHKGERFIPIEKINEHSEYSLLMEDSELPDDVYWVDKCNLNMLSIYEIYNLHQKLLEWHFNVFGLDESEYIKKESLK